MLQLSLSPSADGPHDEAQSVSVDADEVTVIGPETRLMVIQLREVRAHSQCYESFRALREGCKEMGIELPPCVLLVGTGTSVCALDEEMMNLLGWFKVSDQAPDSAPDGA